MTGNQPRSVGGSMQILRRQLCSLMVFTGVRALKASFQSAGERNQNKASHFQIFPTLLTLMGYKIEDVADRYYISLLDTVEEDIGFRTGGGPFPSGVWHKFDMARYLREVSSTHFHGEKHWTSQVPTDPLH